MALAVLVLHPAQAQTPDAFEPADTTTLRAFLPEQFGAYTFDQASAPPFGQVEETNLNAVYEAEDGRALFVVLSHRPPGTRHVPGGDASETTFHGYPAFEEASVPRLTVHVGETVDVAAYGVAGEVQMEDLYNALESLDGLGIEALAAADVEPVAAPEPVAPMPEPAVPVSDGEPREGCAFNEAYSTEAARQFGIQLAPWTKALTPEQAMGAEIEDERLTFAREENAWLDCVAEQDLLWAPDAPDYGHVFLRRVLAIEERPDAVVFHTRNAGLDELILQGRIELETGGDMEEVEEEVIEK